MPVRRSMVEAAKRDRPPAAWRKWAANLGVSLVTLLVLTTVVELGLRLTGYAFRLYPETIEFGAPDPQLMATGFVEDPDVFWVTPDYREKLERYQRERPGIVFLGDSVTDLGHWDAVVAALVKARTGRTLVYGNLGVAGWSSHQGRAQLERDVVPLRPAVVTLLFGWNDHWIGFGVTDQQVAAIKRGATGGWWQRSRIVQLITQARLALAGREAAYPNRVPLEAFRDNLLAMVETARAAGIEPLLVTAATSHQPGEEPAYLGQRWLRDLSELVPTHRAYVAVVREVAAAVGAPICDAKRAFDRLSSGEREGLMMADGIHFTDAGDRWLARVIEGCLAEQGLLDRVLR